MNEEPEERETPLQSEEPTSRFSREVGIREQRKLKARLRKTQSVWTGFGFFGLVGWSIVFPTLIGTAIGRWLDRVYPEGRSWTLTLLVAGLSFGCFNAWRWINREHREIENESEKGPQND